MVQVFLLQESEKVIPGKKERMCRPEMVEESFDTFLSKI